MCYINKLWLDLNNWCFQIFLSCWQGCGDRYSLAGRGSSNSFTGLTPTGREREPKIHGNPSSFCQDISFSATNVSLVVLLDEKSLGFILGGPWIFVQTSFQPNRPASVLSWSKNTAMNKIGLQSSRKHTHIRDTEWDFRLPTVIGPQLAKCTIMTSQQHTLCSGSVWMMMPAWQRHSSPWPAYLKTALLELLSE